MRPITRFLALGVSLLLCGNAIAQEVKVGVLHSKTGTMSSSEIPVANATALAIDEINAKGGVLGRKLVMVEEDGASSPEVFAKKAAKLLTQDKVSVLFGGWTSASRKAMLPPVQQSNGLLFYPLQFEGNECHKNVIYLGAQPNQQAIPALLWTFMQGHKSVFLVGSDYVYPRTTNTILKKHIADKGGRVAGEEYAPLGSKDFTAIIDKIKAAKPQVIINTINGDSNVAFFKAYQAAGFNAENLPVVSFSIGEQEITTIGTGVMKGQYAAWNYFQSVSSAANAKFLAAFRARYGANAVVGDPMAHAYTGVYIWKAAVEKAKSFDPKAVRAALDGVSVGGPLGTVVVTSNGGLRQPFYMGQATANGNFDVVQKLPGSVPPVPFDPLAFPGKSCPSN